jgi:hypothetical protein
VYLFAQLFVIMLRSLGLDVRLIYSMQPITIKATIKINRKKKKDAEEEELEDTNDKNKSPKNAKKGKNTATKSPSQPAKKSQASSTKCDTDLSSSSIKS